MRLPLVSPARLGWVAVAVLSVLLLVDAGAVVLTRMSAPDRTREAGHAAAQAVEGMALTQRTAVVAYDAARAEAAAHAVQVLVEDFRVLPDGRVRLTGTRTAPTLVLHRVPPLRHLLEVATTQVVEPLPYGSAAR